MQYRLLDIGETIKAGDEWYTVKTSQWNPALSGHIGKKWNDEDYVPFRRLIEEPKSKPCPFCGGGCVEDAKFCQRCGKEFPKPLYRLLQEGEKIEEGDEIWEKSINNWETICLSIGLDVIRGDVPFRRKISSFTP